MLTSHRLRKMSAPTNHHQSLHEGVRQRRWCYFQQLVFDHKLIYFIVEKNKCIRGENKNYTQCPLKTFSIVFSLLKYTVCTGFTSKVCSLSIISCSIPHILKSLKNNNNGCIMFHHLDDSNSDYWIYRLSPKIYKQLQKWKIL